VLFFFVHLVARRLLRFVAGSSSIAALEVENAVLRHQLVVLRRTVEQSTIANPGTPRWRCASTSTRRASSPTSACMTVRAST
jgi:hypothetical protein